MPSVGAVTSNLNITSQTVNYAAKANDFVLADATTAAVTITLPATPALNTIVAVKKVDITTSAVSVVPTSPAKIDGDTAVVLAAQGSAVSVQFDGTNWAMLSTAEVNTASTIAGIPTGGAQGQVLTKNTATNYDASWGAVSGLPTGGTAGQVLTKNSPNAGDASWAAASSGGGGGMFTSWGGVGRNFASPPITWGLGVGNIANVQSLQYFFPVRIPNACTLSALSVVFNTPGLGAYTVYLSLFSDVPSANSGGPAIRLAGGSAAINNNANYMSSVSLGNYVVSQPMNAWVAFGCNANSTQMVHGFSPGSGYGYNPPTSLLMGSNPFVTTGGSYPPAARYSGAVTYNNSTITDVSALTTTAAASLVPLFVFTTAV